MATNVVFDDDDPTKMPLDHSGCTNTQSEPVFEAFGGHFEAPFAPKPPVKRPIFGIKRDCRDENVLSRK